MQLSFSYLIGCFEKVNIFQQTRVDRSAHASFPLNRDFLGGDTVNFPPKRDFHGGDKVNFPRKEISLVLTNSVVQLNVLDLSA